MASYLASLARKVAVSADAVARAAAPVDDHGATRPTAPIRSRLASVSMLVEKSAHDIRDLAVHGRAFHLHDIVRPRVPSTWSDPTDVQPARLS